MQGDAANPSIIDRPTALLTLDPPIANIPVQPIATIAACGLYRKDEPQPGGATLWKSLQKLPSSGQSSASSLALLTGDNQDSFFWVPQSFCKQALLILLSRASSSPHLADRPHWELGSARWFWRQRSQSGRSLLSRRPARSQEKNSFFQNKWKLWLPNNHLVARKVLLDCWEEAPSLPASLHGSRTLQGGWWAPPGCPQTGRGCRLPRRPAGSEAAGRYANKVHANTQRPHVTADTPVTRFHPLSTRDWGSNVFLHSFLIFLFLFCNKVTRMWSNKLRSWVQRLTLPVASS